MGIKEYFGQHPSKEDLNIHDITIEKDEPKEELPFDPETEILDSDFEGLKKQYESREWRTTSLEIFLDNVMDVEIISHDKILEFDLDNIVWEEAKNKLEDSRNKKDWPSFLEWAGKIKTLFPERSAELELNDETWEGVNEAIESYRRGKNWTFFRYYALEAKILFPQKAAKFNLDDEAWSGVKKEFDRVQRHSPDWMSFSGIAAEMKILYPKKSAELNIDKKAWQEMRRLLEAWRQAKMWGNFFRLASGMKILAAHKVEVTDEGLKITMRKPGKTDFRAKTPRPERRQF